MKWIDVSSDRPGYRIYTAKSGDRVYVAQMKIGYGLWRLFVKTGDEPLRTIFTSDRLMDCKNQAEWHAESGA